MYNSIRRLGLFSVILAVFNAVATLLLMFYFADMPNFAAQFTWILYTVTATAGFLIIGCALFGLSGTLEQEYTANAEYMHKLNKRIKDLEDRTY